jgi:putative peptidoglycan lipid II flippase
MINVMENVLTVVLDLILYPLMGVTGLALGFSLAYLIGAAVAAQGLRARAGGLDGPAVGRSVSRIAIATAAMAAAVFVLDRVVPGSHGLALLGRVGLVVAAGVGVYLAAARAAGVQELSALLQLRRRPA